MLPVFIIFLQKYVGCYDLSSTDQKDDQLDCKMLVIVQLYMRSVLSKTCRLYAEITSLFIYLLENLFVWSGEKTTNIVSENY